MNKLKEGLIVIIKKDPRLKQDDLLKSVEKEFSEYYSTQSPMRQTPTNTLKSMSIAREILVLLSKKCSGSAMRKQVMEFLQVAVDQLEK